MKNFTDTALTLFQQPRSKLTEPLEHCSGAAGALLQSCWRNVPNAVWKNETAKTLIAKRLQKILQSSFFSGKSELHACGEGDVGLFFLRIDDVLHACRNREMLALIEHGLELQPYVHYREARLEIVVGAAVEACTECYAEGYALREVVVVAQLGVGAPCLAAVFLLVVAPEIGGEHSRQRHPRRGIADESFEGVAGGAVAEVEVLVVFAHGRGVIVVYESDGDVGKGVVCAEVNLAIRVVEGVSAGGIDIETSDREVERGENGGCCAILLTAPQVLRRKLHGAREARLARLVLRLVLCADREQAEKEEDGKENWPHLDSG